ncbi:hypothetical protein FHS55_000549 [Angulomicrobium tetraedrale]|uniref:Uncharacterized protein n=1 Tax=Ancylobacter tetraedralis TaxID=217068 RepID=A0A839Z4P7_9HYPH|nr:hypothetical protein [Ancylobacter tetraedralis]MBB3769963.1 hypothetical protein [Ancylobacter tetraedralis]
MTEPPHFERASSRSTALASAVLDRADRDVAFIIRITGESLDLLSRHFQSFIEEELQRHGVLYGDHPLLRLFVESHSRELTDFVVNGIALQHQLGLQTFERSRGDAMRLLRADLWDTLHGYVDTAEQHFVSSLGGLRDILAQIDADRKMLGGGDDET